MKYRSRSVPERIPIAPDLFTWPDTEPRLMGSRCPNCAVVTFPRQHNCPGCTNAGMDDVLLSRRGTLWTWTTQEFPLEIAAVRRGSKPRRRSNRSRSATSSCRARLEGRGAGSPTADELHIGMEMEMVVVPADRTDDDDGNEVMTFVSDLHEPRRYGVGLRSRHEEEAHQ